MTKRPVPTAEQLKRAALRGDFVDVIGFVLSDVIILHALINSGQTAATLREQVNQINRLSESERSSNPVAVALLEAHYTAETALDRCAHAAHLVLKRMIEQMEREESARYN